MTLGEFNAWLEGYECSFDNGRPTLAQYNTVKEKLATVMIVKTAPTILEQIKKTPPFLPEPMVRYGPATCKAVG